jgi:hypothetical protein
MLIILQARVLGVKKLYDVCPAFRNFMVVQPNREKEKVDKVAVTQDRKVG